MVNIIKEELSMEEQSEEFFKQNVYDSENEKDDYYLSRSFYILLFIYSIKH